MEINELIKSAQKKLKRLETYFNKEFSVLYFVGVYNKEKINLRNSDNSELLKRIELRSQIRDLNKQINGFLVKKLRDGGYDESKYLKAYWNDIIKNFLIVNNQKNIPEFERIFLNDVNSPLYRKFPNCISCETMKNYIEYLDCYARFFVLEGHRKTIEDTQNYFKNAFSNFEIVEPALPENWDRIYLKLQQLKEIAPETTDNENE